MVLDATTSEPRATRDESAGSGALRGAGQFRLLWRWSWTATRPQLVAQGVGLPRLTPTHSAVLHLRALWTTTSMQQGARSQPPPSPRPCPDGPNRPTAVAPHPADRQPPSRSCAGRWTFVAIGRLPPRGAVLVAPLSRRGPCPTQPTVTAAERGLSLADSRRPPSPPPSLAVASGMLHAWTHLLDACVYLCSCVVSLSAVAMGRACET